MVRKALIVGAGPMGRSWGATLKASAKVDVVAWVDLQPELAQRAAADLGLGALHVDSDLGHAIAAAGPDFVVDVSAPSAHHEVTLRALAAGLPVLGEKPMAERLDHAREMVAAAESAGRLYMVSQSRRYFGGLFALRDLVGRLGGVELLDCAFFRAPHFGGFRDTMASPLLLDMAIHSFDAARFITGAEPVSVWCEEWNPTWSWYRGAACATATFEMTGGRFTYRGSWCSSGRPTSWNGEWRATGALGTATWDGERTPAAHVIGEPDGGLERPLSELPVMVPEIPPETAGSLEDFLRALDTGSTPMGECHDNIRSLAMVLAAVESARLEQRVPVQW